MKAFSGAGAARRSAGPRDRPNRARDHGERDVTELASNRSIPAAGVVPVLIYPDVRAAVEWLSAAFGFVERLQIGDDQRSQMLAGEGAVIIGDVRGDRRPPRSGEQTHAVMVRVTDVRGHCERARAHGANIVEEPVDHVFGERQYAAQDLAGHHWTFSETLRDVHPDEWGGILRGTG